MIDKSIIELWEGIYEVINESGVEINTKHRLYILIEEIVETISKWDISELNKRAIWKEVDPLLDAKFYIIANNCSASSFTMVFRSLLWSVDRLIKKRVDAEEYEKASNLHEIKSMLKLQKAKWIIKSGK